MASKQASLGIDLGGTNVRAGKVVAGKVTRRAAARIDGSADEGTVLDQIFAVVDRIIDDEVAAIGCGVPSVVDIAEGVVHRVENIPSWREVRLKDALEARYRRPAAINNDANAFVLGELHFGRGRGRRNVVGLTLGTGLGAGVVCDGRLVTGANCGVGEIGSLPYRGRTLEHFAAGSFFLAHAGMPGEELFTRAEAGEAEASEVFAAYGRELSFAILLVLYAYDPELIVLGGSISRAFRHFETKMREGLEAFEYRHVLARLEIAVSTLDDAAILGASVLGLEAAGAPGD